MLNTHGGGLHFVQDNCQIQLMHRAQKNISYQSSFHDVPHALAGARICFCVLLFKNILRLSLMKACLFFPPFNDQ